MRIGLLRHFPVDQAFPSGWRTAAELQSWCERYDLAGIVVGQYDLGGVQWQACLSSDLPRARDTASAVFPGEVEQLPSLREPRFAAFQTGRTRLPVWMWKQLLWISWLTGHVSQRACRDDFRQRVSAMADRLTAGDRDTLVVSHAGMMAYLSAELRRRGFAGPKLRIAKHARVYVYSNTVDA